MIESLIQNTKNAILKELDFSDLDSVKESLKSIFQEKLVSGSNIKTINSNDVLGEGDINVQANWNETNSTAISYINNKPYIPTKTSDLSNDSNFPVDSEYVHTDNNFTDDEKTKLSTLENYDDSEVKNDIQELQNDKEDKSNKTQEIVNDETKYTSGKAVYTHSNNTNNPHSVINPQLGNGYGTCDTSETIISKIVNLTNFKLKIGGIVGIKFTHSVPANSTLNINGTGAKPIYHNGALLKSGTILSGNIAFFIFDGSNFNLLSDKLISGTTIKTVQGRSLLGSGNVSILESELVRRSFTILNETISGSLSGDTIYLIGFYDFTSETDQDYINGITIDKDLTIIGVDCTIDAHQLANVFNITNNSTVTFRNIEFNNTTNNRTITITNSNLTLYDCIFNNCNCGAIKSDNSTLEILNCNFNQCTTPDTGSNSTNFYGGALNLINSDFKLIDSSFINNSAYDKGGAISIDGKKTNQSIINNCIFENNVLNQSSNFLGQYILGSAISQYGGDVLYYGNLFINNQGSSALSIDPPVVILSYINNCKFYKNDGAISRLKQFYTGLISENSDVYEEGDVVCVNCTFYTDTDDYEKINKVINCINGSTTSYLSTTTNAELLDDLLDSLNDCSLEFDESTGKLTFNYVEYELQNGDE